MNIRRLILSIAAVAALTVSAAASKPSRWEQVTTVVENVDLRQEGNEAVSVITNEGYVYLTVRQPLTVKIFTVLGQMITQETLQPGTYRFRLSSRGIYLLKAGNLTRRITV